MSGGSRLYRDEVNRNGTTRHSIHCKASFGRYDLRCHRCLELKRGAVRRTWRPKKPSDLQRHLPW